MAPHLQGRQAGEELHRALHIIEGDAEVLPQAGELGCSLQEKPQKPRVMIIKRMPNRLMSLPIEDAPALWQEHLVLRAGADRGLRLPPHLLDHSHGRALASLLGGAGGDPLPSGLLLHSARGRVSWGHSHTCSLKRGPVRDLTTTSALDGSYTPTDAMFPFWSGARGLLRGRQRIMQRWTPTGWGT
jgi:hypothetical protein